MPQTIDNMIATWNNGATTFTALKFNITDTASAAASLLMDLQVGGSSRFSVSKAGRATVSDGVLVSGTYGSANASWWSSGGINVATTSNFSISNDVLLTRRGAANLRLGAADAAAPVAQTLSVQSVVTGTSNTAGANLTITGSQGTGTGAGGSIIFQVAPAGGSGTAQNGLATALTIAGNREATFATNITASGNILAQGGCLQFGIGVVAGSLNRIGFSSTANAYDVPDTTLFRDAANTLALRNGANAQTFRVYNTYTDDSNYERAFLAWSANVFNVGTSALGTGTARAFALSSANEIRFQPNNTLSWTMNTSGHLLAGADNTYDIGASGGNRPRSVYVGTDIYTGQYIRQASNLLYIVNGAGILQLSNASNTDFNRIQFGGTTSSFPAIKRSSTTLQARLADDSAFASVQGKLTTDTAYAAGDPTTTGYLVVYDSTGTAYKIPAVAV